eukprot:Gb_14629 [translate_table: standard]
MPEGLPTAVKASMENNENISPCLTLSPSSTPKMKLCGTKRALEETQLCKSSSRRPGRPAKSTVTPIPGSKLKKPVFSRTVKPCTESCMEAMGFNLSGNVIESRASGDICALSPEESSSPAIDSTASAKSSGRSGSKRDESKAKPLEPRTPSLKKASKRKRSLFQETLDPESKAAHIQQFQQEIAALYKYFNEGFENKRMEDSSEIADMRSAPINVIIARLLDESRLPYSKLVQQIHEELKNHAGQNGGEDATLAFVRSSVLLIGQRPFYGISNADADVLEDESESCLWCWEVRDLKLLPKPLRDFVNIRRRCRKKIHERVTALSAMISSLSSSGSEENNKIHLAKAEEMLAKTDDEMSIRATITDLLQKNNAQIMSKEAKLKEKEAIKEKERNDRRTDKEQKRLDRELKREKIQQEKEQARAQKEAIIHEKELKRQQDEAEKEQRRREKEEAEMKKQLAIQKQATIMDRFLHSKRDTANTPQSGGTGVTVPMQISLVENAQMCSAVTMLMDQILLQGLEERRTNNLLRLHLAAWHNVYHQISAHRPLSWGKRRKPKVALFKELRLQGAPAEVEASGKVQHLPNKRRTCNDGEDVHEFKAEKLVNEWEEQALQESLLGNSGNENAQRSICFHNKRRKLLQFDKSHRPAYYGTFSKKSDAVGPRHPFRKDSSLDYENDSDEEWEEEDPGESLSDCDKDDEEENIESEKEKVKVDDDDDDDSDDGFFVPDGYLSENEGVCLDDVDSDVDEDLHEDLPAQKVSLSCSNSQQLETEQELRAFERQQKLLENATEHALRSNRAFIVSNFFKDKVNPMSESSVPGPNATQKLEQICLQALRIRIISPAILVELPSECPTVASPQEEQEPYKRQKKTCTMPDSYLPELVCAIQSSTQGMNKIVELLLKKFPNIAKRQLKNKIRETSDFVENHWQVKKEVLEKLGMPSSAVQGPTEASLQDMPAELPSEGSTEASLRGEMEQCKWQKENCTMLPDSDLRELVCTIQSSTQGMNKIVESVLNKFPNITKRQLKNKIHEISDFVDYRWQVKKEVLERLQMPLCPVQASESTKMSTPQLKGIGTFFSKRCLPPEASGINCHFPPNNENPKDMF